MVTTIRPKNYILGSLRIKAEAVGPSEWLAIVKAAKSICNPYLKYLPDFEPLKETMNDWRSKRKTDNAVVTFFPGFNEESLCVWVSSLSHETEGQLSPADGVRFVTEKDLLLSRKGHLVLWDAKYERETRWGSDAWGPGNSYDVIEIAIFSRFSKVSDDNLITLITHHPRLGRDIVNKLWELANKGVVERQRRLSDFTKMERVLAGFLERID